MSDKTRTTVILVITVVWALNFIATAALPDYKAPPEINSIFMGTVGAVLATAPIGRRGESRRDADQRPTSEGDRRSERSDESGGQQ